MALSEDGPTCSLCGAKLNKYGNCLECSNIENNGDTINKAKTTFWEKIFGQKKEIIKNYCPDCGAEIGKKSIMCKNCLEKARIRKEI